MKKGLIVIVITAVMLTACVLELTFVRKTFSNINGEIETLITELESNESTSAALQRINGISEYWNKHKRLTEVMLNHILLIEYDSKIARLKTDIEVNDLDLSKIDADQLLAMTAELKSLHTPYFHNIF